jgi:Arc/MetJ-type ribon-helix-helix transcriptional regulator
MHVILSPETQKLLEQQMRKGQFSNPDDVLRIALQTLESSNGEDFEDLDPEVRASIEVAEAQHERGEGRPWGAVHQPVAPAMPDRYRVIILPQAAGE